MKWQGYTPSYNGNYTKVIITRDNGDSLLQMSEWEKYVHLESDFN